MSETTLGNGIDETLRTYRKIYEDYALRNVIIPEEVRQLLDRFISYLKGKEVLDVGCAGGRESKYFFEKGLKVTGVDFCEDFKEIYTKRCPRCSFFVSDMRSLKFKERSFDGIWASASFLHLPKKDAPQTLKGFYKILKEDGVLYVSVMKGSFDGLRPNLDLKWPERHFSDYESKELESLLTDNGFKVIDYKSNLTSWGPTFIHFFCRK